MEAVTATIELETYLLTVPNISTSDNDASSNADTPATQKHVNVLNGQPNLMEMVVKLAEKLECLEQNSSKRQQGQQHHSKQRRKRRSQQIICHVCKQSGHYAHGCAILSHSVVKEASPLISEEHECTDVIPDSDVYTIAINSVSNYSVPGCVFGSKVLFLVDTG